MNLENRLKKLEEVTKIEGPKIMWLRPGEDKEAKLRELRRKFGKDYTPAVEISTIDPNEEPIDKLTKAIN